MVKDATPESPVASGTGTNEAQVSTVPSSNLDKRREGASERKEQVIENGEIEMMREEGGEGDEK